MGIRTDNRLQDSPLVPVDCGNCGARVLVRKSSWAQTSVQWDAEAMASCQELRAAEALKYHGRGLVLVCAALRESIEDAARRGSVPIVDEVVD
ncbi:ferredoxin [Mycobacterium sp. IS-3022]|uniref:ferredoxin n=1 Tax=Mycobacterium sp. IS-3022 TaxID=1772277 RepID=UPI0009E8E303|nr:ferredoxin [Mycobacterium sp. IS-3022]